MREAMRVFARFSPKWPVPQEGCCLSSFVLALRDNAILLGRVSDAELWGEKWALPTWNPPRWRDKLLLPAAHLLIREHPDQAANRILEEMLNAGSFTVKFRGIQNHVEDSGHWDVCFVYEADIRGDVRKPPWFSELRYFSPEDITSNSIGRGHADIMREAGIRLKD